MRMRFIAPLIGLGLCAGLGAPAALAQEEWANVTVMRAERHDTSRPLRDIKPKPRGPQGPKVAKKIRPIPLPAGTNAPFGRDSVMQSADGPRISTTDERNFAGVGQGDYGYEVGSAPPDTAGSVGKSHYISWVNTDFAVFRKRDGRKVFGPVQGNTLWDGFGGGCEASNSGDILVVYDQLADRWVMSQFAVKFLPYLQCVAVSATSDPLGSYHRYAFNYGVVEFPDYPKMGLWPDGYYTTYNIFNSGQSFAGSKVCAFDRAKMLVGEPATQQCVQLNPNFGGLLPSSLEGKTLPPNGAPNYVFNLGTTTSLNMWKFDVDWRRPNRTRLRGPTPLTVPQYQPACGGGACIPQKNTTQRLDSLADRLMYRVVYRKRGNREHVLLSHSVNTDSRVGVRWYEFRDPGGAPNLHQSGTFAPGDQFRWMPSLGMDGGGNIAVGYSRSSASDFPAIVYSGRSPGDPLGTLQRERVIQLGGGSQTRPEGLSRWGDYATMSIDPEDDCTFWFSSEYLKNTGAFNWSTRVGSFKFPNCS